jgi:hypothetical protein
MSATLIVDRSTYSLNFRLRTLATVTVIASIALLVRPRFLMSAIASDAVERPSRPVAAAGGALQGLSAQRQWHCALVCDSRSLGGQRVL